MRLLSLDLERYGPFTDRRIAFRPDARLHVVLGANEAGKTSALAAVTDLLFGFGERSRFAFVHELPQLRIAAEVMGSDGRRLVFRRRKRRKQTLVDLSEAPLPDDALAPFLGGLTREVFCRAFGLDSAALRGGAEEMLDSEGEVGASLFAAASGLRGYRALQAGLEEEAAGIFAPRAAKDRTFYQALGRFEEARRAIRQGELKSGDWRDLNAEIEEAGRRLDGIRDERARLGAERARLTRLKRVGPPIQAIDALAAQLAAAPGADSPDPADAWIEALGARIRAEADAREAAEGAAALLARSEADLAALPLDARLLARAEAVLEAFRGVARQDKDAQDLPRIRAEAEGFAQELERLAARIGLAEAGQIRARQPSDAAQTRIESLIRSGRALAAEIERLGRAGEARRAEAAETENAAPAIDPTPLRADLRSLSGLRAEIATAEELDRAIRREAGLLWLQAGRLNPPVPDLAALAETALPSAETIGRHARAREALERGRDRAADRCEAADRAVTETRRRLQLSEAGRPLPTPADLIRLRAARDGLFDAARGADPEALARYREALGMADAAADDLVRDASRAAEQAAARARLEADHADLAAARDALTVATDALAEAEAAWQALWAGTGIAPAAPAEMLAWLSEIGGLLDALQGIETQSRERDHLAARLAAARVPLAELARRAGLDPLPDLAIGALLARAEERVAALAESWESAREAQARTRAAAEEMRRIEVELERARAREAAWRAEWDEALPAIGLAGRAGPDEAEAALTAWRAVPPVLADLERQQRRIDGLQRDMEGYRAHADALVADLAPDLAGLPVTAAVKAVHERLREALEGRARRDEVGRRRDEALRARDAAAEALAVAGAALAAHLGDHPEAGEPAQLHARLTARRTLRAELEARRTELARLADGVAEADLRSELAETEPDAIEAALVGLAQAEEDLDRRGQTAFADRDRGERRRAELEGGVGAEVALAQRKAAEAELQAESRRWAVLKLAGLLLGSAIARQRAGQQDPLLTRAGALFAALTGGAFEGLSQDYDAGDTPRLAGRRAGGGLVAIDGLSEGTRDQLYLALRLAYLEDYAGRSEPAPFLGDDLFLTFDDRRTGHGLEALAAIGGSVQPILFTHHRHVADLAQAKLGAEVDVVEL